MSEPTAEPAVLPADRARLYVSPPAPQTIHHPENPANAVLAELLRDQIWMAAHTSPRSLQTAVGASEIGGLCARQVAYKAAGTPGTNLRDPMRVLAGTGLHEALAGLFTRLDGGTGRYLVEQHVTYRGIPGTVDLFDRRRHTVIDWKSALKSKLSDIKYNGPQAKYVTQVQTYGAGLAAQGERVDSVAIVYVCLDGELLDLRAFQFPFDQSKADEAIDRYEKIRSAALETGPGHVDANPTRLCPWCDHYRPGAVDFNTGCPGNSANPPTDATKG